jgi:hypothetical protein
VAKIRSDFIGCNSSIIMLPAGFHGSWWVSREGSHIFNNGFTVRVFFYRLQWHFWVCWVLYELFSDWVLPTDFPYKNTITLAHWISHQVLPLHFSTVFMLKNMPMPVLQLSSQKNILVLHGSNKICWPDPNVSPPLISSMHLAVSLTDSLRGQKQLKTV